MRGGLTKKQIAACIKQMSGKYAPQVVFADWIQCVAQYWAVDKRFVVLRAGDVGIDLLDDVVAWMPFPKAYGGKSDE